MTALLPIFEDYMSVYVDDVRISDLFDTDYPLWARNMWFYAKAAIPLFNLPAEMQDYLLGTPDNPKFTEPKYASYTYVTDAETDTDITFTTESGFDYYCVRQKTTDALGNVTFTSVNAMYNKATGDVTISVTDTVPQGTVFEVDFYTDGAFINDISPQMASILGLCFQVVWTDRFNADWLSNVTKVEDRSFEEQNRANKMRADTDRLKALREKLAGEMRRYEQNLYYHKMVQPKIQIR